MHQAPARAAALVNGLLVLCLPWIVVFVMPHGSGGGVTVHAWPRLAVMLDLIATVSLLGPFAALAAWRTWVHARHWLDGDRCWRGVLEAGLTGFLVAFVAITPAIGANWFRRPIVAVGYDLFYATVALLAGLGLGAILQLTAMIVLVVSAAVAGARARG